MDSDIPGGNFLRLQVILNIQNIQSILNIKLDIFKILDEKSLNELQIQQKELLKQYKKLS